MHGREKSQTHKLHTSADLTYLLSFIKTLFQSGNASAWLQGEGNYLEKKKSIIS